MTLFNRLRFGLAVAALALGLLHCALTPILYEKLTLEAFWFIGGGIAMICVACSNFHTARPTRRQLLLLSLQNILVAGFFIAVLFVLPAPQVFVGAALFTSLFIISVIGLKTYSHPIT